MNIFAGKPLDYLIEVDDATATAPEHITEPGYETTTRPAGAFIFYGNLRDQEKNNEFSPYLARGDSDDIGLPPPGGYGERAPDPAGDGFWKLVDKQIAKAKGLKADAIEWDNLDTYNVPTALLVFERTRVAGLLVAVKNPKLVTWDDGNPVDLLRHPAAALVIIETGAGTVPENYALRVAAGKPDLPLRFVAYGDELDEAKARAAEAPNYADVGVSFSSTGEYGSSAQLAIPKIIIAGPTPMPTTTSPTPWVADERADAAAHRYHDGADVPMLAMSVARAFPNVPGFAEYCAGAGPSTYWCAIYQAKNLAAYGIMPPFKDTGVGGFMYVDAWADWGVAVPAAQAQAGDIMPYINESGLHHIVMYDADAGGGYAWVIGGNQGTEGGGTVSRIKLKLPSHIRRAAGTPTAQANATTTPSMLMKGSTGPDVARLQNLLLAQGIDVGPDGADGDFGETTEAAVISYQTARGLEVDGIVGDETWGSLLGTGTALSPVVPGTLPAEAVDKIVALAKVSPAATYSWADRGRAPIGYTCGMAVAYAKNYRDFKAGKSSALAMARSLGPASTDALAWYRLNPVTGVGCLRATFQLLWGLGMRESSGDPFAGVDTTNPSSMTSDTAEAGLFQQSWNSHAASAEIPKLLAEWRANTGDGFLSIFRQGVSGGPSASVGSGDGFAFQNLCKTKPEFAVECAAVGLRVLRGHWGPINKKAAELLPSVAALLIQVEAVVDLLPIDGEVLPPDTQPPPPTTLPPPEQANPNTLVLLLLTMILLKEKSAMTDPNQPLDIEKLLDLLRQTLAPPPPPPPPPSSTPDVNAAIAALLKALGQPVAPPIALPPPAPAPAPAPAPVASPAPTTAGGLTDPTVKASAWAFAISALLQFAGYVGTPFGMGTAPTNAGTLTTLIPILTGVIGSTGGLSWIVNIGKTLLGAFSAAKTPAK